MQASIACVLGLITCQRNIHIWETVAPSPVTGWKLPSLHSRGWISRTGLKLIFFAISLFKRLPPPRTFYKHIVAAKATIDIKKSPHSKLLLKSGDFLFRNRPCLLFLLSTCYMIPLGVSQLHDLEIPGRWHHFRIQLRLLFFAVF